MRRTARPGLVLATGLAVAAASALFPAGLGGGAVPAWSVASWIAVLLASFVTIRARTRSSTRTLRDLAWLLPPVILLTLPVALFAAEGRGPATAGAILLRAWAAASAGLSTYVFLGAPGLLDGMRALRVPSRLVDVAHAMLVSLTAIGRQVSGMLRARAARRTGSAPWAAIAVAPVETLRAFGRFVGALLLRSLERAEASERARRARGGGEA